MPAELIYKTDSPLAMTWMAKARREEELSRGRRVAYSDQMATLYGVTPALDYGVVHKSRELMVSRQNAVGLASGHNERPHKDSGWRLDAKHRYWKPALSTAVGRRRASGRAVL